MAGHKGRSLTSRRALSDRVEASRYAKAFVVATEGAKTETRYFGAFRDPDVLASLGWKRKPFEALPVSVTLLPPFKDRSAPQHVLASIKSFVQGQKLDPRDEVWLVLDVDAWEVSTLFRVCRQAQHMGFSVAISNPCVEVWHCLHFLNCDQATLARESQSSQACQNLKRLWKSYLPPSATRIEAKILLPQTRTACQRAREGDAGDIGAAQPWPDSPSTRIYALVEGILSTLAS